MHGELIKAVLLDLGNVLLFFSHQRMFTQMSAVLNCTPQDVEDLLKNKGMLHQLEAGELTAEGFIETVITTLSKDNESTQSLENLSEKLKYAMSDIFTPNQQMISALPQLKARGLKLLLVSNTSSIHFNFVNEHYPWLIYFDHIVLSYEVKAMKPHPDYYRAVQLLAGEAPECCLFVDDIAENIEGAARAGFQTYLFTEAGELLSEFLKQEGL